MPRGADKFLFGTEESHGFLIGQYVRDKDGAAACMLMAELAAEVKASGKTLFDRLESLYWQHGYHGDRQVNIFMTGSAGMARMQSADAEVPHLAAGDPSPASRCEQIRDYLNLTTTPLGGSPTPLDAPRGDMVILDLAEEGHYVAVRPSGTEPKVKFYLFTFVAAGAIAPARMTPGRNGRTAESNRGRPAELRRCCMLSGLISVRHYVGRGKMQYMADV